jgi:hypothetical protein
MYAKGNPRTKKELKRMVERYRDGVGGPVYAFQPGGMFPGATDGPATIEGPHYPEPHKFYASVILQNSIIISVK